MNDILITKSCLLQTLISYYNILSEPNFGVAELDYNGNPKELPKKYQELIDKANHKGT